LLIHPKAEGRRGDDDVHGRASPVSQHLFSVDIREITPSYETDTAKAGALQPAVPISSVLTKGCVED
jgi:hypothetical protein